MLKQFIFTLTILLTTTLVANEQLFKGTVTGIIPKEESSSKNDVYLELSNDSTQLILDDFTAIYLVEYTHKLLFSDYIGKDLPPVEIALKNITTMKKEIEGEKQRIVIDMEKINPNAAKSDYFYNYNGLNSGIPKEDFYHRYVTVPVDYDNPNLGTFNLYYELCSDYEKSKPTIIIPTDGQRTFSQVGMADEYKEMFGLHYNTVTFEYRGMYASAIPQLQGNTIDWNQAYEILNAQNVVEDIERIRQDLLGDEKVYILGGSGTAMIGMKYVANYPNKVEKAFLMSFFKDAKGSSEAGVSFFSKFLEKNNLMTPYKTIIRQNLVDQKQLLFLIQRLFYYDKGIVKNMLLELEDQQKTLYEQYKAQLGSVSFFIRSAQKYKPWSVVFMYETNIKTSLNGLPDINYPFYEMGAPVREVRERHQADLFDINNLSKVDTEILLVAGTLDQVAPVNELKRIHRQLPNSKLAIFEAYHCLQASDESKECRSNLANRFFKTGEIQSYLNSKDNPCKFVEILE